MKKTKLPLKKTKIVCTIGPASQSQVEQMMLNGMNIARINFAHGNFEAHRQTIAKVRAAAAATNRLIAIFGDLPGPKMRIGKLEEEPLFLERGQSFILQTQTITGNQYRASMDFEGLPKAVKPGDSIFMNDGYIQLMVERVEGQKVHCTVKTGGELRSHKGVNFPGIDLGLSAFTPQDRKLLAFAAEEEIDGVSQSFVQNAADIIAVREAAAELDYDPFIIAKIERSGALQHIEEILDAADGLMVARGDLGVEIPIEDIPAAQKQLIRQANLAAKPVITATQMLESMTRNRRPTRAEVTDVANAILDGSDAIMLSGETAIGDYPAETVAVMARIAQRTEETCTAEFGISDLLKLQQDRGDISREDLVSSNIFLMAKTLNPALIFIPSLGGATARRVTRFRLSQWIVAPSRKKSACQQLQFSYGVYPVHIASKKVFAKLSERRKVARKWLKENGEIGDLVLLIEGAGTLKAEDTRRIDIIDLK
ncbi:MAG: pyruvate kinase [Anaerolineaceae bacterium 4572_5.2]|nr:MAG: pyruvate kinase [Anaerolineaceae bacterium 4572_5.2]